jgi:hypothetical protein
MGDFLAAGAGIVLQELSPGQDHAGGAIAALQGVAFPESFLHRMQLAMARESFDGGDLGAVGLDSQERAGLDGLAIEQDGAGAAQGGFATDMRSGQPAEIAQEMNEQQARLNLVLVRSAIDSNIDGRLHKFRFKFDLI